MTGPNHFTVLPNSWSVDRIAYHDAHHGQYTIRRDRTGAYECAHRRTDKQEWDVFAVDVVSVYAAILECQADMRRLDRETFKDLPIDVEF